MTISDQTPIVRRFAAIPAPVVPRALPRCVPRLASLQLNAEALVFGGGRIRIRALIEGSWDHTVSLWLRIDGHDYEVPVREGRVDSEIELAAVDWWWPATHGEQAEYPVRVSLLGVDGEVRDSMQRRIGFRWAEWATEPDRAGNPCILVVNGRPVRVRGVDWTPEPMPLQVDREAYSRRLGALRRANLNLLRIRDARFEGDLFYDLCDELGLLVWQDLRALHPADAAGGQTALEARLRSGLPRVAGHPSIVLLQLSGSAQASLQQLAADLAPQIPLVAAPTTLSPATSKGSAPTALQRPPRFVTSLAVPSGGRPPAPLELAPVALPGEPAIRGGLEEALELAAEVVRFRIHPDGRAGVLIARGSSLPGSPLDTSGLLRQVVARACADRLVTLLPDRHGLCLTLLNDSPEVFASRARIRRLSHSGVELARHETDLVVWSYSGQILRLPETISRPVAPGSELVLAEVGDFRAAWFFPHPRSHVLNRPRWRVRQEVVADGLLVLATADVLVRDACLFVAGEPQIEIEGGPVTLLPGETAEFRVRGGGSDPEQLAGRLVLTCRNDFGSGEIQPVTAPG